MSDHAKTCEASATLPSGSFKLDKVCRSYRKKRRGAAAVEFAVIAPVFLLVVFGMIEYGRMVMVQQVITNASREGARVAILDGASTASVTTVVNDYLEAGSIDVANASQSDLNVAINPPNPSSANFGDSVTVTVTVSFAHVGWLPSPMYLGNANLTATTVMRKESTQ